MYFYCTFTSLCVEIGKFSDACVELCLSSLIEYFFEIRAILQLFFQLKGKIYIFNTRLFNIAKPL